MKNKKMVLALVLITVVTITACAQQYDPESDFKATPIDGGRSVRITEYVGSKWSIRIPPKIQGLPVTHIGRELNLSNFRNGVFCGKNLISITIPDSVTYIGDYAFAFNQLTSVTIPSSVTSIGVDAFSCDSLNTINVAVDNTAYSSENGVLYNKSKTYLYKYPSGKTETSFIIPNSVTNIGDDAFSACTRLNSIIIPDSVTSIGNSAFSYTGLTSVTISNSVTSIGIGTFSNCTNLTSVTMGSNIASIGDSAFRNCTSLVDITIPSSVTSIGMYAFADTNLTSIIIPNSVTSIGNHAFDGCIDLKSVTFQGIIPSNGFSYDAFPCYLDSYNNLRFIYFGGRDNFSFVGIPGTYIRVDYDSDYFDWKKQ